jgi:hypothetical protein
MSATQSGSRPEAPLAGSRESHFSEAVPRLSMMASKSYTRE